MLNNVPVPGETLNHSRPLINGNFSIIDTAFSVDHVAYQSATQGKHNQVTMPVKAVAPTTLAGELALYSRISALTGIAELAFRRVSNGVTRDLTAGGGANPGWTLLPANVLLKWGSLVSFAGAASKTVNLNTVGGPNYTNLFSVFITPIETPASFDHVIAISNITASSFTVSTCNGHVAPATLTFAYLALGNP